MSAKGVEDALRRKIIRHKCILGGTYIEVTITWTDAYYDDGKFIQPGAQITDFKAPGSPHVNWKWVDAHAPAIFSSLPFTDS
jgi:hypothetical protein